MNEISGNIFLVPLGNFLDHHLRLVYPAGGEEPARGLWDKPPARY